jgi:hypothetical protein
MEAYVLIVKAQILVLLHIILSKFKTSKNVLPLKLLSLSIALFKTVEEPPLWKNI